MKQLSICTLVVLAFAALCPVSAAAGESDLERLVSWMSGSFSSAEQAAGDKTIYDLRLHMTPIWTDRSDGRWLYVEQAAADTQATPYRQRMYRLTELADGLFERAVFSFDDPLRFVGAWQDPQPFVDLSVEDLSARQGCSVILREVDDRFVGSTLSRLCTSQHRGASYASTEMEVSADAVKIWDRGYDENGRQVWGSEKGGTVYRRVREPE